MFKELIDLTYLHQCYLSRTVFFIFIIFNSFFSFIFTLCSKNRTFGITVIRVNMAGEIFSSKLINAKRINKRQIKSHLEHLC